MGKANKHKLFNKEAAKAYGGSLKHFIKTIPPKKKPGAAHQRKAKVKRLEKEMSKNIAKYELFLSSLAHVQS